MDEKKFVVLEGDTTLASEMTLDDALLFIGAYINKYYCEHLSLRITEMPKSERESRESEDNNGERQQKEKNYRL